MKDLDILKLAITRYPNMSYAEIARNLSAELGFQEGSIRGRLSRSDTPRNRALIIQQLLDEVEDIDPSTKRQQDVITASQENTQKILAPNKDLTCVFLSDVHFPYVRNDALELAYTIIQDIRPDIISAGNDLLDNAGYGRWDDTRSVRGKLWSSDITRVRRLEKAHYKNLRGVSKGAALLHLMGNHDTWYYSFLRRSIPQDSEEVIADYMEFLYDECGVYQFSDGSVENSIRLSPNLTWWHGQFAASSAASNAANTIAQFTVDGVATSVVVGHTHRPSHVAGFSLGRSGVDFYNNGCLCRLENVPYLKRDPRGWGLGITVSKVNTSTRYNNTNLLVFSEDGNQLRADYNGKTYTVPLAKSATGW